MSTIDYSKSTNTFPTLLIVALVGFVLLGIGGITIMNAIDIQTNTHAVDKHGEIEVAAIRDCIQKNGPFQVWRDKINKKKYFLCAELKEGCEYGIQIVVENDDCELIEKSAFMRDNPTWNELRNYLSKFSDRWKGFTH